MMYMHKASVSEFAEFEITAGTSRLRGNAVLLYFSLRGETVISLLLHAARRAMAAPALFANRPILVPVRACALNATGGGRDCTEVNLAIFMWTGTISRLLCDLHTLHTGGLRYISMMDRGVPAIRTFSLASFGVELVGGFMRRDRAGRLLAVISTAHRYANFTKIDG